MGDPLWLTLEAIADMTDRQIYDLALHECRRQKKGRSSETFTSQQEFPEDYSRIDVEEFSKRTPDWMRKEQEDSEKRDDLFVGDAPASEEEALAVFGMLGAVPWSEIQETIRQKEEYYASRTGQPEGGNETP